MSDELDDTPTPEADAKVEAELARVTVPEAGLKMGELPEPESEPEAAVEVEAAAESEPEASTRPAVIAKKLPEPPLSAEAEMKRMTRRGLITGLIAAAAGYGSWRWLLSRPDEGGIPSSFRKVLQANEEVAETYFSRSRLTPTFPLSAVSGIRVNGHLGLAPNVDPADWKISIEGAAAGPVALTMADIRALPRREMTTEFKCIEGWSFIVHWTGARLSDLMERFPPAPRGGAAVDQARLETMPRYVALETPGRGYYVGLDMASALHPQTLLAYEMNGEPLSWDHGAPIRLAIPVKYGIKNIKRIGVIRYTDVRPADFWAEQGYDWYAGH